SKRPFCSSTGVPFFELKWKRSFEVPPRGGGIAIRFPCPRHIDKPVALKEGNLPERIHSGAETDIFRKAAQAEFPAAGAIPDQLGKGIPHGSKSSHKDPGFR